MLLLSSSASAAWERLWDQRVDTVVVKHGIMIENMEQPYPTGDIPTDEIRLFATHDRTGDIYRYSKTQDQWTKVGNPGKKFVATGGVGSRLYGLDPAGMGVYEFTGTPMNWRQVGGPAANIYAGGTKLYATNPEDDWEIYEYTGTPWQWEQIGEFRLGYNQLLDYVASGGGYKTRPDFPYTTYPSNLYMLVEDTYDGQTVGAIFKRTASSWDLISAGNLDAGDLDFNKIYGGGFNSGVVYAREQYSRDIYRWSEDGQYWEKVSDSAKSFVVDQYIDGSSVHNLLYRLKADGELEMYDDRDVGSGWTQIGTGGFRNPLKEIYAAGGELYGVTEADYIYKYVP